VKGQVEHVLMLVVNLTRDINASPVDVLHAKVCHCLRTTEELSIAGKTVQSDVESISGAIFPSLRFDISWMRFNNNPCVYAQVFANYRKWCAHLDVRPQFSGPPDPSDPGRVGGKAADLLLWFFIWGEAANLRHMPESLCFLYHKCMQSWKARSGHALEGGQRYPGHFLDNTVTPIYEVVKRASSAKKVIKKTTLSSCLCLLRCLWYRPTPQLPSFCPVIALLLSFSLCFVAFFPRLLLLLTSSLRCVLP